MVLTNILLKDPEHIEFAWWVEIITLFPFCSYSFGPFANIQEAAGSQLGYLEDLKEEGARVIKVRIKLCQPQILTSFFER